VVAVQVAVPNHIGDAVMALGPLRRLAAVAPDLRLVGRPAAARVLDGQGAWGRVHADWARGGAAVLLAPSLRVALQAVWARTRPRIGAPSDARRLLLTQAVDVRGAVHHREGLHLVVDAATSALDLAAPDHASERLEADPAGVSWWQRAGQPDVLLHPWAVGLEGAKRWPRERWIDLGRRLGHVAVTGGPDPADAMEAEAIGAALGAPVAAGEQALSIGAWAAAALSVRRVVVPDTGLAHVAAAAGAEPVVLFGPSDPARFAPRPARVVAASSMDAISVDRVWEAACG